MREFTRVHATHIAAVEVIGTRRRSVEAAEHVHQRALARARRTHDGDHLIARNREIKPAQRVNRLDANAIDLRERAHFDDGCRAWIRHPTSPLRQTRLRHLHSRRPSQLPRAPCRRPSSAQARDTGQ